MKEQFIKQPNWSEIQDKVLKSNPNIIISGCAGSGKTLLACHLAMLHSINKDIAILVFTKSLRTFIKDYIESFGDFNITIMYEYQWRNRNFPKFDIIIVDEFQDFSINDIDNVINCSNNGVYLFGDEEQKIYNKNFKGERTIEFKDLIEKTKFEHFHLTENFRISKENKNLISSLYQKKSLENSNFTTDIKPNILQFENQEDEMNWLKNYLISNTTYKNIGILLKQNDGFRGGYYYKRRPHKDDIWGIMEFQNFFEKNGINSSYKYKSIDNLDFTKDYNINIMTYHSSKGMQFDCVILPFSNFANENNGSINLPYVGLTRSTNQIIITYTGLISKEFSSEISPKFFDGKIVKKTEKDNLTIEQSLALQNLGMEILLNNPIHEEDKKIYHEYDFSDCKNLNR